MLAVARALLAGPRYLIMDEPSEGLAPAIVARINDLVSELIAQGMGVLLLEQDTAAAPGCLHMVRGALTSAQTGLSTGADPAEAGAMERPRT
jgi:ABC-type branched-subunit amino acid transport system ATPase component